MKLTSCFCRKKRDRNAATSRKRKETETEKSDKEDDGEGKGKERDGVRDRHSRNLSPSCSCSPIAVVSQGPTQQIGKRSRGLLTPEATFGALGLLSVPFCLMLPKHSIQERPRARDHEE